MLFCTENQLEKINKIMLSMSIFQSILGWKCRTNKEILAIILVTFSEMRLSDLRKHIRRVQLESMECFYAVNVFKLVDKCYELYNNPEFKKGEEIKRKSENNKNFLNKQLVDFAMSNEITDSLTLMYEYAHLADPCDRLEITKEHDDDHINEKANAQVFVTLGDRKRAAKNAVECVIAKMYYQLKSLSNINWLEMRCRELGSRLLEESNCDIFGQAWYYCNEIIGQSYFNHVIKFVLNAFMYNPPKRRYIALCGGFDSGKSTFAAALCKFFDGVSININIIKERLPFYLGSAIGKRFILFDDVKGKKARFTYTTLPAGPGVDNLDDMRDYLDGHLEVQLEKKNQNPIMQKFPCGIITMNNYELPDSLKKRIKVVQFVPSNRYSFHNYRVTLETIFIAMVLLNLVPVESAVVEHFSIMSDKWKNKHSGCGCSNKRKSPPEQVSSLGLSFLVC